MLYILAAAAGFAACWFVKDPIQKLFLGAESFAEKLRQKAKDLLAKV